MKNFIHELIEREIAFESDGIILRLKNFPSLVIIKGVSEETIQVNCNEIDSVLFLDLMYRYPEAVELF